ncbi:energy-coupling factor transporter ATPase [Aquibacillus kalidii]|uniref:energy-coupling factor transporter ATPase n=1 Tax=Aquibacillus kalidii TaxID=2762597 RepID=UPI0016488C73|nr:energy-coupling factor transporter ATPase [Aquibacillus kalidii]
MTARVVEVSNLVFGYDKRDKEQTLTDINFSVNKGEWVAVIGHNGSGKSTLAKLLVGLLEMDDGSISIAGINLNDNTKWEVRRHIGLVFQNPENQFVGTTVQDDVAFGLENINMPYEEMNNRVEEALKMVDLSELRFHDPSRLSGGQKQRVALAGILALRPSVLVLDEALVMLDPGSRRELLLTLKQLNKSSDMTIISITHDMDEAAEADRILLLEAGRLVDSGKPSDVFSKHQQLEPPFSEALRRMLKRQKNTVPDTYMTEEELVNWLCKSHLKM